MIYKTITLWEQHPEATLTTYVTSDAAKIKLGPVPAVIVVPGGGYTYVSRREAEPIAFQFMAAGFSTFILDYTTEAEKRTHPVPLIEAALAVKYVREHADEFNVDPTKINMCGFSAGGHVAASAGILWNSPEVRDAIGVTAGLCPEGINRPDGLILCYPVITAGKFTHKGSIKSLSGHNPLEDEDIEKFSLELHVDDTTPPAFIWHTFTDAGVPVENSLLLASALREHGIPFELHVFPSGPHGLALANEFTMSENPNKLNPAVAQWVGLAEKWVKRD